MLKERRGKRKESGERLSFRVIYCSLKRKWAFCTYLMKKAPSEYYSSFINNNSSDQRKFFKAVNISLILRMTLSFHLILLLLNWLMTLATFFDRLKIVDIRSNFPDLNNPQTGCMEREAYLTSCFS